MNIKKDILLTEEGEKRLIKIKEYHEKVMGKMSTIAFLRFLINKEYADLLLNKKIKE